MAEFPDFERRTQFEPIEITGESWGLLERICMKPINDEHRKEVRRAVNNVGYNFAMLDGGINSGKYNTTRTAILKALNKASRGLETLGSYNGHNDFYRAETASIDKIKAKLSFDPPVIKPHYLFILELTPIWVAITGEAPKVYYRSEREPHKDKANAGTSTIHQYTSYKVNYMEYLAKFLDKRRGRSGFIEFATFALMQLDDNIASRIVTGSLVDHVKKILGKQKSGKSEVRIYRDLIFESHKSKSKKLV